MSTGWAACALGMMGVIAASAWARNFRLTVPEGIAMFWIYLRRELRRRMRQAISIALGLALGIGLVITVTSAATGVQNAQASVLHTLYGVGTDITITQPPRLGTGGGTSFGFRQDIKAVRSGQISAGTKIDINQLANSQYGTLTAVQLAAVMRQPHVTGAVGGLSLTDVSVTGTAPALSAGSGSSSSSFTTNTITVDGAGVGRTGLGPLGAATVTSGRAFTTADATADATADVALADSGYEAAHKLRTGSKVDVGGATFTIVGIVSVPQSGSPPNLYIPLARAQALGKTGTAKLTGELNTLYVSADSASDISAVQQELTRLLPTATVTDASELAGEVTGSASNASSLANSLGKWVSVAVLIAAFGLAILLTMSAVARRVREFGTLKAIGWRGGRIVGQVMGESLVIGIVGGAAGVGLGYAGAALVDKLANKLSAVVGGAPAAPSATGPGVGVGVAGQLARQVDAAATHTVYVTLTAPVTLGTIGLVVLLAVAGGLLAGAFGGWRAARLRPAAALRKVG
jgi:ABC-type antimicrobial peptide transport system permease subunit